MDRRSFLKALTLATIPTCSGCALFKFSRVDPWHFLIRSDRITSLEQERAVLAKAKLTWTDDGQIRVLFLQGTPYERGYQHGVLLRSEIEENLGYIYSQAQKKFHFQELFSEVYERIRPYLPEEYVEEMHGLAHGARLPISMIHHVHALPSIGEWGGKKKIKAVIKDMMEGELGTSCSNFSIAPRATADGEQYVVRILDWGLHRISKLHQYPLIAIHRPDQGIRYAVIGWVGFIGAVSGMNAQGITLGEMGYGDPENETLRGRPMVFLLRDVLRSASNLKDVKSILQESIGAESYAFLMSDGKTGEAQLYIKDRDRFIAFAPDKDVADKEELLPAIPDTVYGGHFNEKMTNELRDNHGKITLSLLKEKLIPEFAMKSNFQNVIYLPRKLQFWVTNAKSKTDWAASQPYTFFDLGKALESF